METVIDVTHIIQWVFCLVQVEEGQRILYLKRLYRNIHLVLKLHSKVANLHFILRYLIIFLHPSDQNSENNGAASSA